MIEKLIDDVLQIDCMHCGKFYPAPDGWQEDPEIRQIYSKWRMCPECVRQAQQQQLQMDKLQEEENLLATLDTRIKNSGLEMNYCHDRRTGNFFLTPPVPYVAEFIERKWNRNILLSGKTGTGKSTSATFMACRILRSRRMKICYATLRQILAEWRDVKTGDSPMAVEKFLWRIYSMDLLILDEVVGKARISESGQEFLFELLEAVNSGACSAKVWLLGNFYNGSIEDIFSDPEPVRRRLQENFICAVIDPVQKTVNRIQVWNE